MGYMQLGARLYDPAVGRFLSPDPIGFGGGVNLYAYCEGDPANAVDPEGTYWSQPQQTSDHLPSLDLPQSFDYQIGIFDPFGLTGICGAIRGRNYYTNQPLEWWERGLGALPLLGPMVSELRLVPSLARFAPAAECGMARAATGLGEAGGGGSSFPIFFARRLGTRNVRNCAETSHWYHIQFPDGRNWHGGISS